MDQELTRAAAPRLKRKHPHAYLAVAFLCPALVLLAAYFAFGVYPFGGESVLVLDLNAQYVYFFGALRRVLYGDASLFYSFSRALGGEFLGIFAYYLASPLSLLVALFPADNILDALLVIFTLKCGLCSVTLAYYLEAHGIGTKPARIIFGALYALSGYGMIYQHNTMWIDCMMLLPLVALGIEKLISEKKYKLFTLSLGLAIFTNFYIGYMMCIFCFIYFFYAYFCIDKNPLGEKKHFLRALVRMGLFSAIAVGLAVCIILPTYYSLGFGKTTFSDPTYSYKPRFDLLDLAAKLFLNSYDTVRPEGLPILYCGMLSLLFVPLFFIAKKVPLREKVGTGVLIGIFVFSFSIDAVDKFWHGMQAPNWLNYRYSFMLIFILVVAAAKAFREVRSFTAAQIGGVCGGLFLLAFAVQKLSIDNMHESDLDRDLLCIWLSVLFIAVYAAVVSLFKSRRYRHAAHAVLAVIVCAELLLSSVVSICYLDDDVVCSTRKSYLDNKHRYEDSVNYILENDDGFYRFDKTKHSLIDTPMALGIRGFTNSTSTLNRETIDFLRYMGLASKSHWSKYLGATAPFDTLLGVKYVIVDGDYAIPDTYVHIYDGKETGVYENPDALSIAYAVNGALKDFHLAYPSDYKDGLADGKYEKFTAPYTPPERMNRMTAAMLGEDGERQMFVPIEDVKTHDNNLNSSYIAEHTKYEPINDSASATLYYEFNVPADGIVYMYLPSDYPRECALTVGGSDRGTVMGNETNRMIALGSFRAGEAVTVGLTLKDKNLYIRADEPYFWQMDDAVYTETAAALGENQFNITKWRETRFEGTLTATDARTTVFTSIPYDANWRVTVDGEAVETYKLLDALVGFDVTPGEHTVVIRYVPRQFRLGLCITVAAALLLLCIILLDRAGKIRRVPQAAAIGVIPAAAETHAADVAEDADTDANANEETPENAGEASADPAAPVKPDDSDGSDDSKGDA